MAYFRKFVYYEKGDVNSRKLEDSNGACNK